MTRISCDSVRAMEGVGWLGERSRDGDRLRRRGRIAVAVAAGVVEMCVLDESCLDEEG
jgi:hypothetical protein